MTNETNCCDVWSKYERCKEYNRIKGLRDKTETAYRFYEGDQWHGVESGGETLPIYNFIKPTVNYKSSMIAMNSMVINYSIIGESNARLNHITAYLNAEAMKRWERLKMDSKCWKIVRGAMIAGDAYIYFYDEYGSCQIIENTDIFFGDEQQQDIQKQPHIIIAERRFVNDVTAEAKQNGVSEDEIKSIISDDNTEDTVTTEDTKKEVQTEGGKCTCLLYLQLDKNGDLKFCRCTKHVVYQPIQTIEGMHCYPIASFISNAKKGSSRGRGEVEPLINNQIEVNRTLARRILNAKINAYPRLIYSSELIQNPKALTEVGTALEVDGANVGSIKDAVDYLRPPTLSNESINLTNELLSNTRELAGAGDAALGNVDPTQASGTAIIAVRDQTAIPLNEPTAAFRQFVEDIAKIWLNIERVYHPQGVRITEEIKIEQSEFEDSNLSVNIDISSKSPFSKYAREQSIERLFAGGHLSFEEYVELLDDDSSVPKAKLQEIISKRQPPVPPAATDPAPTEEDELAKLKAEAEANKQSFDELALNELAVMERNRLENYGG